ncbi:MAG: ParA family protein [Rhizobiales bacterium]|nr:ParA family protein [Hyphomicrobiales bacterium]
MISVLVANPKGGCGKTTIATNLASAFANAGFKTALADGDRQRSALSWLKRRPGQAAPITGLDWRKSIGKVPDGTERLVIDSGAGLRSQRFREFIAMAEMTVMPVLPSRFDHDATRRFLRRIEDLKPIRKGKKPVSLIANRLRVASRAESELEAFAESLGYDLAARLRDLAVYADVAGRGLGIFDLSPARRASAVGDWISLIRLIED